MGTRNPQQGCYLLHLNTILYYIGLLDLADLTQYFDFAGKYLLAISELVRITCLDRVDVHIVLFLPVLPFYCDLLFDGGKLLTQLYDLLLSRIRQFLYLMEELAQDLVLEKGCLFLFFGLL